MLTAEEVPSQQVLPRHGGLSLVPSMYFPKVVYWSWLPEGHFPSRTRRQQRDAYEEVFFLGQALEGWEARLSKQVWAAPAERLQVAHARWVAPQWDQNRKWGPGGFSASHPSLASRSLPGSLDKGGAGGHGLLHQEPGVWEFGVSCILPAVRSVHAHSVSLSLHFLVWKIKNSKCPGSYDSVS